MTTTTHEAKIIVSGQADGAVAALDKTSAATDRTTTAAEAAGAAQAELVKKLSGTKAAHAEAREALERVRRAQEEHTATVKALGPASEQAAASQRRLTEAQHAAAAAASDARRDLEQLRASLAETSAASDKVSPALARAAGETARLGKEAERQAHEVRKLEIAEKGAAAETKRLADAERAATHDAIVLADAQQHAAAAAARTTTGMTGLWNGFSSGALKVGAAVAVFAGLGAALGAAADRAVQVTSAESALTISIDSARRSTGGLVSNYNLATAANSAMGLGVVKTEAQFARMSEAAAKLALKSGTEIPGAVTNLVTALGRGSTELLDNYGIVMTVNDAQKAYATQIGKTVDQLTEEEKKSAFKVIALERVIEAADASGVSLESNTAKLAAYNVELQNFSDQAAVAATSAFGSVAAAIRDTTAALYEATRAKVQFTSDGPGGGAVNWVDEYGQLHHDPMGDQKRRAREEQERMSAEAAADDPVARYKASMDAAKYGAGVRGVGWAGAEAYQETDRDKRIREKAEKEHESWLDQQAALQMQYGPLEAKKEKKAKKGKKLKDKDTYEGAEDDYDVKVARSYWGGAGGPGDESNAISLAAQQAEAEAAKAAAIAADKQREELLDKKLLGIDREMEAMEAKGVAETQQTDLLFWSLDQENLAEEEREQLHRTRLDREQEFAAWQVENARTTEQRAEALTRAEAIEHKKRILNITQANAAEAKEQQKKVKLFSVLNNSMQTLGASLLDAIEAQAKGEKGAIAESVAEFAKGIRNRMILKAAEETAFGVAAAAGIVTAGLAAPHFVAAGVAAAAAALAGGAQAGFHAIAKSQGFGAEKKADSSGGDASASALPEGATDRTMKTAPEEKKLEHQDVPISFDERRRADATINQQRPLRPLTINFYGPVAGDMKTFVSTLKTAIRENDKEGGKF